MTDDLAWRLRLGIHTSVDEQTLRDEAAHYIERLTAALNDMAQYVSQEDWDHFLKPETRQMMREADD